MKICSVCTREFDEALPSSIYVEAGAWLSGEVWDDAGTVCPRCLENRAQLAMMYCHDINT